MPSITVIVPVYNVEPYIHRCIDSILSQSISDFDVILIDDGSPDMCGTICDEYAKKDSRIHVIHQENQGLSAARNVGIDWALQSSESQWITFIDSDDWIHPNFLELLLPAAMKHGISVAKYASSDPGSIQGSCVQIRTIDSPSFLQQDYSLSTVVWGKLFPKECFSALRFPLGRINEDAFVTYRILIAFKTIPVITFPLYVYCSNPSSIMRQPWSPRRLDALDALEEQVKYFEQLNQIELAETRFKILIERNRADQQTIIRLPDLSPRLKKQFISKLKKQLRRILIHYRRYNWISIWNRGDDLWVYSDTFFSVHIVHMIWRSIKRIYKNDKR